MIGFKKTPAKLVISIFLVSVLFILLIYIDSTLNEPDPVEEVTISIDLNDTLPAFKNKLIHIVEKGESLSVIFEEKKVSLNTAYKIFNFDKDNILSSIKPGDLMEFNYVGKELNNIEIIKDDINSIIIDVFQNVSIKKVKKKVQNISSFKQGDITSSFYQDASDRGLPDSIIM